LKALGPLLPKDFLVMEGGRLSGNLSGKNLLTDPEFNGELRISSLTVESKTLVTGRIGPFSTSLIFSGKNFEAMPASVPLENGIVGLSASGLIERWTISDLKFNVATGDNSVVTLSAKLAGITMIDAKAKINMVLSLDNDAVLADGSVFFERGQVLIDPQGFMGQEPSPGDAGMAYRIQAAMTFGKQLEVYLPDNKLPLVRGFAAPTSKLLLKFDSDTGDFSLDGKIDLKSGYVLYYLRNFFLKEGVIDFAENNTKFNPLITAKAELREASPQGPVRISLAAERSPLNELRPSLSSVPSYSETQLIALMSGGVLATDTTETLDIREAAIASSEFIPQLNIFKTFERNVQKALGVDIVYIRSTFMQRWLLDLTKPATEANPEDPLARYMDQSELYIGKYLTDSVFLHAGLKFREDPLESASRLRLDSEFGIELDSPFGLINWSITPSWNEGSLVTGQQLSLSWRYVF
ncbi:MAG TPA: translocation/assembly module TamB domain-containing protein, partial [Rectinemataceae bacterium]